MTVTCDAPGAPPVTRDAARAKAYRVRKRRGLRCVTIRLAQAEIQALEDNGYLEGGRTGSALADAVELFLSDHMPQ